jgi:hypothetical protein
MTISQLKLSHKILMYSNPNRVNLSLCSITIFVGLNEENTKLSIKKNLITDIQKIIGEFGSFTTADIQADCDVSIPSIGNHIHLANHFYFDSANVEVYEDGGDNEIDSYLLNYFNTFVSL